MNWRLPQMARQNLPLLPQWWLWPLLFLISIAIATLVLFFTWPVQRGFSNTRFWLYLLLLPILLAFALGAFVLSARLQARRYIEFRHMYIDYKRAKWQSWARRSLNLTGWHMFTPEPDLALRILGLEGSMPQASAKPMTLLDSNSDQLSISPLAEIIAHTLAPLAEQLSKLQGTEIWFYSGESENHAHTALMQGWKTSLNKQLPQTQIHHLDEAPNDGLLTHWINEKISNPYLLLCCQLSQAGTQASEFSVALLFQPDLHAQLNGIKLKPVHVFRPQKSALTEFEQNIVSLIDAGQTEGGRLRHLWDAGLERREQSKLISLFDENKISLSPNNLHVLPPLLGPQSPASFWLALCLAAEACDLGQRGQLVAAQTDESISLTQLSTRPAMPVNAPPDTLSRYPLAYLGGIFAVMLALILLPGERDTQMAMLPWLGGGFVMVAALLSFAVPLALHLWRKQLDVEWHLLEQKRHD